LWILLTSRVRLFGPEKQQQKHEKKELFLNKISRELYHFVEFAESFRKSEGK